MEPVIQSVFDLSIPEKLQLVQDLWDDLGANPESIPIPEFHKEEVLRRKARLKANPSLGSSWEDVKRRVRSHYGR